MSDCNPTFTLPNFTQLMNVSANTVLTSSYVTVRVDASAGNVTLTLPTTGIFVGKTFSIKLVSATNQVIISGTIDGQSSITLTAQYSCLVVQWNGTNYDVISNYTP